MQKTSAINQHYQKVVELLETQKNRLERPARRLLEVEVLDSAEFIQLAAEV